MKKVLFVCSGNIDRSPTAEALLRGKGGLEVKSAGTLRSAPTPVSKELIKWADIVFAMERSHKEAMLATEPEAEGKIVVLGIEDQYPRGDPQLVKILKEKLSGYFTELCFEDR
jgi:predicted protein tyrosine phosphatase